MAYDISDHPLLSDGANALSAEQRAAHGRIAEQVLGLAGSELTGEDAEAAKDAIVVQLNYQVDVLPDRNDGSLVGETGFSWLDDPSIVSVSPLALRMAARLVGTGWKTPAASVKVPEVDDDEKPYAFDIT